MSQHGDQDEPEVASDPHVQAEDQPTEHKDDGADEGADDEVVTPGESVDATQHPDIS